MTARWPEVDPERLLRLSEEVSRIATPLAEISKALTVLIGESEAIASLRNPTVSEETVRCLIRARRERTRYLSPELLAEPAWDMLLDLLHAELTHRRVPVSSLCTASGVPPTTALRWLNYMIDQKLVIRRPDPFDGRRAFAELTPEASGTLRRYVTDVVLAPGNEVSDTGSGR